MTPADRRWTIRILNRIAAALEDARDPITARIIAAQFPPDIANASGLEAISK
jgi:hypothetical protein